MRTRFRDKKVDRDWLNTNFPVHDGVPGADQRRPVRRTHSRREVRRSLPLRARSQSDGQRLRPRLRAPLRDRLPAGRDRQTDRDPRAEAFSYRTARSRVAPSDRASRVPPKNMPYRVAIVGSGPVGLSAAHDLALMGYTVTIFEAAPVAGGMLCLGIPEYRLPRSVVEAQVREILDLGDITLKLNHAAGRDFTISGSAPRRIRRGGDRALARIAAAICSIPGIDMDGVLKGIDFLLNANLGYRFSIGKRVVVIGGGNVAMDVARSAAREVLKQHAGDQEGECPIRGQYRGRRHARNDGHLALRSAHGSARGEHRLPGEAP